MLTISQATIDRGSDIGEFSAATRTIIRARLLLRRHADEHGHHLVEHLLVHHADFRVVVVAEQDARGVVENDAAVVELAHGDAERHLERHARIHAQDVGRHLWLRKADGELGLDSMATIFIMFWRLASKTIAMP